uniref:Phage protein n=1 Tax=Staphylococcus phage HS06 TaxID=3056400 RepID=A0AA49X454_9VIRU|nr:MAG: hypothetical protein [Staphylococcus phage HS06]
MVKIKREVEMTLPELIEWGLENGIKNKKFVSNRWHSKYVNFSSNGYVGFSAFYSYLPEDTFTVEVEEEITEEKVLKEMFMLNSNTKNLSRYTKRSIASVVKKHHAKAFYVKDNDFNMMLIWKDGELVK